MTTFFQAGGMVFLALLACLIALLLVRQVR